MISLHWLKEVQVHRWSKFCLFGEQSYVDSSKGTKTISALEPIVFLVEVQNLREVLTHGKCFGQKYARPKY